MKYLKEVCLLTIRGAYDKLKYSSEYVFLCGGAEFIN